MFVLKSLLFCAAWLTISGQNYNAPTTTPVPILKQINKQNDDGSYSFGYEAADGSFKIETKYPNGDVAGKYGYVDDGGKLREISYGASSKRGFEPQGNGIVVPPPSLNQAPASALADGQEDDGQYREDPKIYEDPKYNKGPVRSPSSSFRLVSQQEPEPQQYQTPRPSQFRSNPVYSNQQSNLYTQAHQSNEYQQSPQTFPQSQVYHQQPQFQYQGYTPQPQQQQQHSYQPQNYQQPNYQQQNYQPQNYQQQNYQQQNYQPQNYNPFLGHPAQNFDPSTGSYTINFTG